jgi:ABC-type multidrug transport system fused ATPase/permease subunit
MGLDSPAGEGGASLSGGQRQRISIARALVKNSPIICMDEPTSALDDRSETLIRESIGKLIQGKTVILVTHRLSLLALMDKVYVLEGGILRDVEIYGGYEQYAHYLQAHEQL